MKRGSALLIVLGMVSFMVVSSVAFSIYMRTSRQPSSYLRRNATSRYMLKAALANAIERIDGTFRTKLDLGLGNDPSGGYVEGVFDDPYPGIGPRPSGQNYNDPGKKTDEQYRALGNRWVHRVFMPFGDVSQDDTVATLTFEALAYLPPAVINEVRVLSRQTRTAMWNYLTYEAGRYAFCAVDVSDCFDVNKVRGLARTSAANQRIGFSAMFPSGASYSAFDTGAMSTFNTTANQVSGAGQVPFVSLADFNLFFGAGQFSPFCNYFGQASGTEVLRKSDAVACNGLYVTDTWFPPTNTTATARFNLSAGDRSQPFDEYDEQYSVEDVLRAAGRTELGKKIRDRLGGVGTVCLYDYLDADSVPTSYALPTVETAPMVCALGLKAGGGGFKPTVQAGGDVRKTTIEYVEGGKKYEMDVTATPYEFDWGLDRLHLYGLAALPFKRLGDKTDYKTSFKAEGLVRVFLAPENLNAHLNVDTPLVPRKTGDWKDDVSGGFVSCKVTMSQDPSFTKNPEKMADALKSFEGDADFPDRPAKAFWMIERSIWTTDPETKVRTKVRDEKPYYSMDGIAKGENVAHTVFTYDRNGLKEKWWDDVAAKSKDNMFEKDAKLTLDDLPAKVSEGDIYGGKCVPHVAVWVRLYDGNDTVDYVPAYAPDDVTWGRHNESENDEVLTACGDTHPPILRFSGTTPFPYGISAAEELAKNDGAFRWSVLYTVDPRFNYAPEAWYAPGGVDPSTLQNGDGWLTSITGILGSNGRFHDRDPDIFMFTSDQEYLQSIGELQFLPLTRDLAVAPGQIIEDYAKWDYDYQFDGKATTVLNFMPGMWETYSAVDGDPVYNLGDPTVEIVSSRDDFRINPFTQDERVFRAAIANTPYDYFVASTNDQLNVLGKCDARQNKPKADDGVQHAFNSATSCAKWTDARDGDSELLDISDEMHGRFLTAARNWNGGVNSLPVWERIYDDLDWYDGQKGDEQKHLFGVELSTPLHAVDRKFLHSFWRECFQNRQQLFLVFVRAEPLTVGGSGKAALASAQLGARGVALVWRDPAPPQFHRDQRPSRMSVGSLQTWKKSVNNDPPPPHRTRVLFYHQFE